MPSPSQLQAVPMFDFGMTEIEEQLRGENGEAARRQILARLDAAAAHMSERLASGLPPEEFARTKSILRGLAAAREVMLAFK